MDLDFKDWYESDWLSANLRTVIDIITIKGDTRASFDAWEASHVEGEILTPSSDGASMLMLEEGTLETSGQPEDMVMVPVAGESAINYINLVYS